MRIVIDMQGAQTESRDRGIGRYSMSFAQAVVRNRGEHEIFLALNGLFPDSIEPIRTAFDGLLLQGNIRIWYAPGPVREDDPGNETRREVAELIREAFIASLQPDVVHISSLFEGYVDDAVNSIGRFDTKTLVSVALNEPSKPTNIDAEFWQPYRLRKTQDYERAHVFLTTETTAPQAIAEWEATFGRSNSLAGTPATDHKPKLAVVSPLPPERTGIADYVAELLPALAKYYDIELVVAQERIDDPWVNQNGNVRDIAWLRAHVGKGLRVLYHIGNSSFHAHMIPLLEEIPGAVVLHDFFLGHLLSWIEAYSQPHGWRRALYDSHGYGALRASYDDTETGVFNFPVNWHILQRAQGVIVHSEYSRSLARDWYGGEAGGDWEVIPLARSPVRNIDKYAARQQLGIAESDFVVCSFGFLGGTKLNHRLLQAWLESALAVDKCCHLVYVGENDSGDYGASLLTKMRESGLGERIRITGFAAPDTFCEYLAAADLAVQLRTQSRGETSAAVLDCMNHALPIIVNASGSMAELDPEAVWLMPHKFSNTELIEAMETLWRNPVRRQTLGERARAIVLDQHTPEKCAKRYAVAIERFHQSAATALPALLKAIVAQEAFSPDDASLVRLSEAISTTLPLPRPAKRLYVDISIISRNDIRTGIQRVTRALTLALLESPPTGYRVEPVYLSDAGGVWHYRHARTYTLDLVGCPANVLVDESVDPQCGDILLLLDLAGSMLTHAADSGLFMSYRGRGVLCIATVYDLLPVLMPEVFPPGANEDHYKWLEKVCELDGAVCISRTVANELKVWHEHTGFTRENRRPFTIGWFHLGADVSNSAPSQGLPHDAEYILRQFKARPSFLMVGTIEPRKGYMQVIEAFTQLWEEGVDINLIIVGGEGWKGWVPDELRRNIPETAARLRSHPELNKRLFWLESISDEYLEKVYAASTCLIAASYGEGFGLPLIEAAQHKLPIIARDIPVFREVAGECALYFDAKLPPELAEIILEWLSLYRRNEYPRSENISGLTWMESAKQLLHFVKQSAT